MFSTIGYFICIPFAALLRLFYNLTGSYGLSLIFFTLIIKLVLLPFQMKSKKSMVRMNRMSGKMQEIQKKYANNQMKMNEEMQKFYAEEGINPMSGCLWSFLPMPIMIALYYIIREPVVFFMNFGSRTANLEVLQKAKDVITSLNLNWSTLANGNDGAYAQIEIIQHISSNAENPIVKAFLAENPNWVNVDYHFLGLDLTTLPSSAFGALKGGVTPALIGIILIPILSGLLSFLLSKVSMAGSQTQGSAAASGKTMMLMMPLMSVYIAFIMPAALGVYWIANSVWGMIRESVLGKFYTNKLNAEEDEREAKREAARKLRMEEAKKRAAEQREQESQRPKKPQKPKAGEKKVSTNEAGRIGERPYARGRSYQADRYEEKE